MRAIRRIFLRLGKLDTLFIGFISLSPITNGLRL